MRNRGHLFSAEQLLLADARNVRVEGKTLMVSSVFDWYGDDFTAQRWNPRADTIQGFISLYAAPEVAERLRSAEQLEIVFLEYDWVLNASTRPRAGRR